MYRNAFGKVAPKEKNKLWNPQTGVAGDSRKPSRSMKVFSFPVRCSKTGQNYRMVTQVSQTWNSLLGGLERIDAAFNELEIGRE
jgi:hypothetical protein